MAAAEKQRRESVLTMTAAGLLDNEKGRNKLVKDRFEQADVDNSGTLDTDEVIGLIGTLCADINLQPPRDEKVVQLMAMCDTDKSGMLERDKFFKIVLRDAAKRASMLGKHDSTSKLAG